MTDEGVFPGPPGAASPDPPEDEGEIQRWVSPAAPLPPADWEAVIALAVDAVSSVHTKRAYAKALADFGNWYAAAARPPLSRAAVQLYRSHLEGLKLAPSSVNLRLSAIRKLAAEAAENGWLDRNVAQGILSIKGLRQSGTRVGNWLTSVALQSNPRF